MEVAASEIQSQTSGARSNTQIALYKQSELTMMQLARAEEATKPIFEAHKILKEIEKDKEKYYESIQWIHENSDSNSTIHRLEKYNEVIKRDLEQADLQ